MLGLMFPTWLLSCWMSNATTTLMMVTIVGALVTQLDPTGIFFRSVSNYGAYSSSLTSSTNISFWCSKRRGSSCKAVSWQLISLEHYQEKTALYWCIRGKYDSSYTGASVLVKVGCHSCPQIDQIKPFESKHAVYTVGRWHCSLDPPVTQPGKEFH